MENYNGSRRTSLRQSLRGGSSSRQAGRREKNGFLTRLNICLTLTAALILFSKININLTNKIADRALSLISAQASFSDVKDKAREIFAAITSGKPSEDVFSDTNSDIAQDILDKAEQDRAMEEQLKNR